MLKPGIYEQVINEKLKAELDKLSDKCQGKAVIEDAQSSQTFTQYLTGIVYKAMNRLEKQENQIPLVNAIVEKINEFLNDDDFSDLKIEEPTEQLLALLDSKDPRLGIGKTAKDVIRPQTSISQSSLFTGSSNEPQMFSELKKEIVSSQRIDMLVSFIKWSGLRLIMDELQTFVENGGHLRIVTTSYMGATDAKAIEELRKLPNTEVKISYDTKRTRLHAKTYIFYRDTGFTTAYVGSSNLSNVAMSSGLEWNLKITEKDLPDTIEKIAATFNSYWHASEFESYQEKDQKRLIDALRAEKQSEKNQEQRFFFDIRPYGYQQEILDRLQAEREVRNKYKNLVVAATGTGKTVISAFDYRRFRQKNNRSRLLFVAHREEILKQSVATFRVVLRDNNFGDLFVGLHKPESFSNLFVSIQTINSQKLYDSLPSDFYDYIVIDEFHHAAAPTYQRLLEYFKPAVLLGLTATPERMDGKDILSYFDGRIAAEIRLPEAINRKLLCPFQYFGVTDDADLSQLKWSRGGYDIRELEKLYTMDAIAAKRRATMVISSIERYVTDLNDVKGLGFCVSIAHAEFMSEIFNQSGIPSIALSGKSSSEERNSAKSRLVSSEIRFIFVVDIYNEGVDIPEVNTLLFLRPTESLTVFLQQLGRGLRLAEGKECLTVLDFIAQANKKYNFEEKFAALLSNTSRTVRKELEDGFVSVPRGSFIQLEKKAEEYILENIKGAFSGKNGIIRRIESFEQDSGRQLTLANFLDYYHLDIWQIYKLDRSFARMCADAGVKLDFEKESAEDTMSKMFKRLIAINSRHWIDFILRHLRHFSQISWAKLTSKEQGFLRMFYITVFSKYLSNLNDKEVQEDLRSLDNSPYMMAELEEILLYSKEHIDFIDESIDIGTDCSLDLYCSYTRDQILVALDFEKPSTVREGVKWLPEKQVDVLLVTLNKSEKDFKPTTRYEDYSIDENLFHWQSQGKISVESPTGQRYIHHKEKGSHILLFVREFKEDQVGAAPYTCLGKAFYREHTGSQPMSIIWELERPIPAKYLKKTTQLLAA